MQHFNQFARMIISFSLDFYTPVLFAWHQVSSLYQGKSIPDAQQNIVKYFPTFKFKQYGTILFGNTDFW